MGFLGFLKKKKDSTTGRELLLPPKAGGGEAELPSFPEQEPLEDLNLPEIPEFEQANERLDMPELPASEEERLEFEFAPEPPALAKPEMIKPELTMPKELVLPKEPRHESMEDAYKYTPAEPKIEDMGKKWPEFPKKETEIASLSTGSRGEVFIRGEDYRNIIEGLEEFIRNEKEKNAKQEKDSFKAEDREYEKFMKIAEDIQRSLIITENNIFE